MTMPSSTKRTRIRERRIDEASQQLLDASEQREQNRELNAGRTVFVLGLDYDVKSAIHWTEAVTGLIVPRTPADPRPIYTAFKVHETKRVRSAGGSVDMAWPLIVRLNFWYDVPFRKAVHLDAIASRHDILRRDGWTCAYCAGFANTIDHVYPESRGGGSSWGNLVAACSPCNGEKDDRTPEEAGMKLLWNPRAQDLKYAGVQAEVWRILTDGESLA